MTSANAMSGAVGGGMQQSSVVASYPIRGTPYHAVWTAPGAWLLANGARYWSIDQTWGPLDEAAEWLDRTSMQEYAAVLADDGR